MELTKAVPLSGMVVGTHIAKQLRKMSRKSHCTEQTCPRKLGPTLVAEDLSLLTMSKLKGKHVAKWTSGLECEQTHLALALQQHRVGWFGLHKPGATSEKKIHSSGRKQSVKEYHAEVSVLLRR